MKRFISTALSTLLLFTGMICPAVLSAVGLSSSGEMQAAGSWRVYTWNTPSVDENGTIAGSWAAVTVNTDEKYVNSGVDSLKLSCKSQNAVLLIDVNKNKDYEIVFNYYSETLYNNLNESYIFSRAVVQKPSGKTAWNSEDNLSMISYNISYTGPYSQRIENQNRTTTATVNEWNQFSISFNSGDNDQVALILVPAVDNVYVDDLNLVEKSEAMDSTSLNDAANWYDGASNQVSALPIAEEQSWSSVNNVTGDDVPGGAFESALRCNGNNCIAFGTKLMLEPNTTYTLSFSYYAETSAKISSESQNTACLKGVGAYPFSEELKWSDISGSMAPNNWNLCANTENKLFNIVCTDSAKVGSNITGLCNKPSGEWNEFSATFNSQNVTEALFYFNKQSTTVDNVYIADLKLVKKSGDLNDPSAWKLYENNSTHIGENGTPVDDWAKVTENTDAAYIKDGDSSLNFSCISQRGAAEFEVEQNKNYTISFKYYSDSLNAAGTYILSQVAVVTPNGAVGDRSEDNLSYVSSGLSYTGPYSERETNSNSTATTETGWHDFEISFNSGGNTKLALTILFAASPVYVDCIELKENTEAVESDDLNDPSAWKLYKNNSTHIGENGTPVDDWAKVTENTDAAYIKDGDSSLNFSCISQRGAAEFEVEQNKNYTISFKYYSDSLNAAGTYILSQVAVVTPNGAVGDRSEDNLSYVSSGLSYTGPYSERETNSNSTATTETGWHDFEISFNSGGNTKLALTILFAASPVYVDCIELKESTEPIEPPEKPSVGEPKDKIVIDFEDESLVYSASPTRIDVVSVAGYDGTTTKALHTVPGTYSNATFLNYSTTTTDSDKLYTMPVLGNRVYELSWRVKIADDSEVHWLSFYKYYNGSSANIANLQAAAKGEWLYYKVTVVTETDQDRLSFTFNAGNKPTAEMWVDDITLMLTDNIPFDGHQGVSDQVLINFDDYMVNLEQTDRMSIAKGPERNGSQTKALYVKGGSYSNATFLNWSTTTKDTDPVFTIPVKENTLYNLSFYVYIPKNGDDDPAALPYFGFFWDYNNTKLIRPSGMEEMKARNEWVRIETTFITTPGQSVVSLCFNLGAVHPDIYLDDILLKEIKPGLLSTTPLSFCEEPYNLLNSESAGDLHSSKTSVVKIAVEPSTLYTFGVSTAGGSLQDKLYLSFDGKSAIKMSDSGVNINPVIYGDSGTKRQAFRFVSDSSGYVYVVFKNISGDMKLNDAMLFRSSSISTGRDMGYEQNPNISEPAAEDIKSLALIGQEELFILGLSTGSVPNTGGGAALTAYIIASLLSALAISICIFGKKWEGAK